MHLDKEAIHEDWEAVGVWFQYGTRLSWFIVAVVVLILFGSAVIGRTVSAFH